MAHRLYLILKKICINGRMPSPFGCESCNIATGSGAHGNGFRTNRNEERRRRTTHAHKTAEARAQTEIA